MPDLAGTDFGAVGELSSDAEFDKVYEPAIRELSYQHWTPVAVGKRAAKLLTTAGATRILDVGSGVGKFCIVGASSTRAQFVGVERRGNLVEIARRVAVRVGAVRASFVHADFESVPFDGFDGVYLYNPFYEQISKHLMQIDDTLERSSRVYGRFVHAAVAKLESAAAPLAVVTFNGFGGLLPPQYEFVGDEPAGNDRLELWVKR